MMQCPPQSFGRWSGRQALPGLVLTSHTSITSPLEAFRDQRFSGSAGIFGGTSHCKNSRILPTLQNSIGFWFDSTSNLGVPEFPNPKIIHGTMWILVLAGKGDHHIPVLIGWYPNSESSHIPVLNSVPATTLFFFLGVLGYWRLVSQCSGPTFQCCKGVSYCFSK